VFTLSGFSTGDRKQWKLKPKEEWVFNEAPRIVSDELWQICNDILDDMAKKNTRTRKKGIHLFSGILICSCGSKMYMRSNYKKYVCQSCKNKISPDDLEEIFHIQLENFLFSDIEMQKHLDEEKQLINDKEKLLVTRQKELIKINKRLTNLMDLYHEGDLPKRSLKELYNEAYTNLKKIEKSILKIQTDIDIFKTHSIGNEQILHDAQNLHKQWHTFSKEEKKSIIELITDKITIGKEDIEITLSYLPTSIPKPTQTKSCITTHNPYIIKECKYATNRQGCVEFLQMVVLRCERPKNPAYPTELQTIGDHIRKVRLDRQLSQFQVSTIIGVTNDTITNWELNRNKPRILFLLRIFEFIGYIPSIK